MLRQLGRLERTLPDDIGMAYAVYMDASGAVLPAQESGFEGVACLDDAARALVLWCDIWKATGALHAKEQAYRLYAFCKYQLQSDGLFLNFIYDWSGTQNRTGPTSRPSPDSFWQARGARAFAKMWATFDDPDAFSAYMSAAAHFNSASVSSAACAVWALAGLDGGDFNLAARACTQIASLRKGKLLVESTGAQQSQLWGHIQEDVLAKASRLLQQPQWLDIAHASAQAYLFPLTKSGFDLPLVQPYGVSSVIFSLRQLRYSAETPQQRRTYWEMERRACDWFYGRNPGKRMVYDPELGRVADGIDNRLRNEHSGAESNIVAAQALLPLLLPEFRRLKLASTRQMQHLRTSD